MSKMWRWVGLIAAAVLIVGFGFSLLNQGGGQVSASAVLIAPNDDLSGYARAIGPWDWHFPADYGAHPRFQTEWWYYTGNLADASGRRFGYQFTIFRRAIAPTPYASDSEWRTNQIYMAHFTVTDVQDNTFYEQQRFSRGSADLAGAVELRSSSPEPRYRVWLEDWQVAAPDDAAAQTTITASTAAFGVNFHLKQIKPPALEGDHGLSQKGPEPGSASYYYSLSRLLTDGTLTVNRQTFTVSGTTWMDHEFSTEALGKDVLGWDWFGLQLDDNRELMLGQIRLVGGSKSLYGGTLINPDGTTGSLTMSDFSITPSGAWKSPHTDATYPSGWNMAINLGDAQPLKITLTPLILDQELQESLPYWEGAVRITGDVTGYGYAELTGYATPMTGRF
jgi:predicted secreted hydrolase